MVEIISLVVFIQVKRGYSSDMKLVLLAFYAVLSAPLFASPLEDFFTCSGEDGKVVAKVFVDSSIFCEDNRLNSATLLIETENGSSLYNGDLLRWESGQGESFIYSRSRSGDDFEISATLPYGLGSGVLATTLNGEVTSSQELSCITKQIHVDCP